MNDPTRQLSHSSSRVYEVYVCDRCGDITDAHGEPVGCVNISCDAPTMRRTRVREYTPADLVMAEMLEPPS